MAPIAPMARGRWPRKIKLPLTSAAAGAALLLAACTSDDAPATLVAPAASVVAEVTTVAPAASTAAPVAPIVATEVAALPPGDPLPEERAREILALLGDRESDEVALQVALDEIVARRDVRFVAPLIELLRAGPARLGAYDTSYVDILRELTGAVVGRDWDLWVAWYGRSNLEPPPGFAAWKGELLSGLDERFADFLYEGVLATVPIEGVVWGGVPVDGITSLQQPPVLEAAEATYLDPAEPVFGVVVNGEARAYPLRIMDAHEMANDTLGGVPIALAYCTLCGTGIAYDARGPEGVTLDFGTSGLLYESNKLMYDRQTGTLWNQFTGRPVIGPLVEAAEGTSGSLLDVFPIVIASWDSWVSAHPETTVLDIETGVGSGYTLGYPYLEYFISGDPLFPVSERSTQLSAKDWVFGLDLDGAQKAYSLDALTKEGAGVVNDTLGGVDVVVVSGGPIIDVVANGGVFGELQYEAGGEVRAFERPPGVSFEFGADARTLLDATGASWQLTEEALVAAEGELAARLPGHVSFWFGWFQFFPRTEVFGARN